MFDYDDLFKIFKEFDRMFDSFFKDGVLIRRGPDGNLYINGKIVDTEASDIMKRVYYDVVYDEDKKEVVITVEIPGVEKNDINLKATPHMVFIKVDTERRKLDLKIPIKYEVDPNTIKATYKNGVLEIRMKVVEPKTIDVE